MVNLDLLLLHSSYNAFKNISVQRNSLVLPASMAAGEYYTNSIEFTLEEIASFMQGYNYSTDYSDYFNYLDSQYHDTWRSQQNSYDHLVFSSSGLLNYFIRMQLNGNKVTFTLSLSRVGFGAVTIRHDTYRVPITFIEYRLAN